MRIRIVAVRHAKPLNEGFADEQLRPLSTEGTQIQHNAAITLRSEGIDPTLILTSPLLRAHQTAEVLSNVFFAPVKVESSLGYDFSDAVLLALLSEIEAGSTVILVGHEPTLAQFVNKLVGSQVLPRGLQNSAAAVVEFRGDIIFGEGVLLRIYTPHHPDRYTHKSP